LDIELLDRGKKTIVSQRKKILFLSTLNGAAWGGSEVFWYRMAQYMAQQGHGVTVAWLHWPERQTYNDALRRAGCTVVELPNHRFAANPLQKLLRKKKAAAQLTQLVRRSSFYQVVISQSGFEDVTHGPFHVLLPLLRRYILLYHNYNKAQRLGRGRSAVLQRWASGAALNLGASQQIFDAMPQMAGFAMHHTGILYNPIGFAPPDRPAPWPPLQEGQYIMVMLAQLDCRRKAQDRLVEVLAQPQWQGRNWQLWLYGDGPDANVLKEWIQRNRLQDRILLKGHTQQVQQVLAQSHLLLQLTHIDAMPIAVVEAMSMGRPCAVTKVGDMPQWVTDGVNGWVAASATVADIAAVLEKAWQLRPHWPTMGERAFATFAQQYPQPYEAYYGDIILNS
jgi:glycosyltransferase involved in cell wall biosynthesis